MNREHPSYHPDTASPESCPKSSPSFLARKCQHYNLGELALVFGLGSVLAALLLFIVGVGIPQTFSLPVQVHTLLGYSALAFWFILVIRFWLSLVAIGKSQPQLNTCDKDLHALQFLFYALIIFMLLSHGVSPVLFPGADWQSMNAFSLVFEWAIIGFQVLYFLLAFGMRVRVPAQRIGAFFMMLALTIFQTKYMG